MDWAVFLLIHNQEEGQQYLTENDLSVSPYAQFELRPTNVDVKT